MLCKGENLIDGLEQDCGNSSALAMGLLHMTFISQVWQRLT